METSCLFSGKKPLDVPLNRAENILSCSICWTFVPDQVLTVRTDGTSFPQKYLEAFVLNMMDCLGFFS